MKRSDWLSLEIQTCQSKLSTSLMHMYMESSPDHPLGRKKNPTPYAIRWDFMVRHKTLLFIYHPHLLLLKITFKIRDVLELFLFNTQIY